MSGGRLLVAYSNSSNFVATTAEYLASIGRHSTWDVRYLHVTHEAEPQVDLAEYDAVLQSYCVRLPFPGYVASTWLDMLRDFRGIKVLAVQDEYDQTNRLRHAIRDIGFDAVLTCVPGADIEQVYPAAMFPNVRFVPVLTGYVPDALPPILLRHESLSSRPIVIGYRGRDIGPRYGRLGWDKLHIGEQMKEVCAEHGIPHDIAWGETDRLYGQAWYDWIASCRVNLGTESGSNAFDWDGEIEDEYRRRNLAGGNDWGSFLAWVAPYEAGHNMGQISPRIFEATAMGTGLVLYPGSYSGILEPDKHYIPLERDLSNIDDVINRVQSIPQVTAMVRRTRTLLIDSGTYSYRGFVRRIDRLLFELAQTRGVITRLRPPLEREDAPLPMVDCPALRSMVEHPTRELLSPLVFAFKHTARENRLLREAVFREKAAVAAFSTRLSQENRQHNEEIAEARSEIVRLTTMLGSRINGEDGNATVPLHP